LKFLNGALYTGAAFLIEAATFTSSFFYSTGATGFISATVPLEKEA